MVDEKKKIIFTKNVSGLDALQVKFNLYQSVSFTAFAEPALFDINNIPDFLIKKKTGVTRDMHKAYHDNFKNFEGISWAEITKIKKRALVILLYMYITKPMATASLFTNHATH